MKDRIGLPDFLHIGGGKCASGWLYRVCLEHPEIYVPSKPDNVNFFTVAYHKGMDWYQSTYFSEVGSERAVGEFSNSYSVCELALERIARHMPDVKLTFTLRDPAERAYLHWAHLHLKKKDSMGGRNKYGFDPDQKIGVPLERGLNHHGHGWFRLYYEPGFYAYLIRRIYRYFKPEQVLILLHDDLVADDHAFTRRFFEFIGVDPGFETTFFGVDANPDVKEDKHRPDKAFFDELRAVYREDICELEDMLGRDLSHWKRGRSLG